MQAFRIKKHLDSDTIYLPVLKNMIGKNVEIIILAEPHESEKILYSSEVKNSNVLFL